ncbi:GlsB/YeaQ/YmgE family stress response membrane protein [Rhodococcus sp. ACT016]|uniref:GlsB/YeaQ/YmgE family stress response membrane protein n=1 Tax=Rhodococcus sp. ACT016 TaxID=3134808 RepID=UPI003D2C130F
MGEVIGTIIFGAVIGVLARLVIPGKQAMGWIVTVVIGIIGALIGYWVWGLISDTGNTPGIDWWRWIISIAVAVVLTLAYTSFTSRRT